MGGVRRSTQFRHGKHRTLAQADRPQRIKAGHYRLEPCISNAGASRGHSNLIEIDPKVQTYGPTQADFIGHGDCLSGQTDSGCDLQEERTGHLPSPGHMTGLDGDPKDIS